MTLLALLLTFTIFAQSGDTGRSNMYNIIHDYVQQDLYFYNKNKYERDNHHHSDCDDRENPFINTNPYPQTNPFSIDNQNQGESSEHRFDFSK